MCHSDSLHLLPGKKVVMSNNKAVIQINQYNSSPFSLQDLSLLTFFHLLRICKGCVSIKSQKKKIKEYCRYFGSKHSHWPLPNNSLPVSCGIVRVCLNYPHTLVVREGAKSIPVNQCGIFCASQLQSV